MKATIGRIVHVTIGKKEWPAIITEPETDGQRPVIVATVFMSTGILLNQVFEHDEAKEKAIGWHWPEREPA